MDSENKPKCPYLSRDSAAVWQAGFDHRVAGTNTPELCAVEYAKQVLSKEHVGYEAAFMLGWWAAHHWFASGTWCR